MAAFRGGRAERRRCSLVLAAMKHSLASPALAGLFIAATAFGLHLGESAIAEIHPIHFDGPAIHPRDRGAAVVEAPPPAQTPRFASLYGWAEGAAARSVECGECATPARAERAATVVRDDPPPRAIRRATVQLAQAVEPAALSEPLDFIVETAEVARYADFPIEAKPDELAALEQ